MRYLVTGAAGFIGSHLVERLLRENHEVIGVDNFITGQPQNLLAFASNRKFSFIEHDICTPLKIDGAIDVIFDFACPASPVDFTSKAIEILRVCSEGVWQLLNLALEKEAIFVHASTSECYGDPAVHPQPETYWGNVNPVGLRSSYDEGKRFAEALTMAFHRVRGLPARMGRIFNTYGPRMRPDDGRVLPNFMMQALANEPLTVYGTGKQTRSFCYVTDLVEGFMLLSRCSDPMPFNIGNNEEITIHQLATEVIELTGSKSTIAYQQAPQDDPKIRCPDTTRARQILGWKAGTKRRTGLLATIEYFRKLRSKAV